MRSGSSKARGKKAIPSVPHSVFILRKGKVVPETMGRILVTTGVHQASRQRRSARPEKGKERPAVKAYVNKPATTSGTRRPEEGDGEREGGARASLGQPTRICSDGSPFSTSSPSANLKRNREVGKKGTIALAKTPVTARLHPLIQRKGGRGRSSFQGKAHIGVLLTYFGVLTNVRGCNGGGNFFLLLKDSYLHTRGALGRRQPRGGGNDR